MKSRFNLTLEPKLVHQVKRIAKKRNTSFSAMVEDLLREAVSELEGGVPTQSFSARWGGGLKLVEQDEQRMQRLTEKYGN
ncbi:MAG: ribbon-helix-helix domain-containing protein [Verrucomicrobiales bacterium]|nr:ribbon-helix-helix domain-containing protein [Verrucomicrobiales bacterium]